MFKRLLPVIVVAGFIAACTKDKLGTTPKLELKDINGSEFTPSQDIVINFKFRDKEGDLGGGVFTYYRNRQNVFYPAINKLFDSASYTIPEFPEASEGEVRLLIPRGSLNENPNHSDSVVFKIVVKDLGGHTSDTITTPLLVDIDE